MFKKTCSSVILLCVFNQFIFSQTFSEWRGEGRTGVYNETGLLKKWPEKGPEMLWSVTGLPKGNSSVVIGDRKLYITGTRGSQEVLIALDRNGKKLWETSYGRAWEGSYPESRSTPTLEDNRIYVTSGMLDAACINALTGQLIWSVKVSDQFQGKPGLWGRAESPVVWGNMVYFTPGGEKTTMVALDKMTGKTIWQSEGLKEGARYVSPLFIDRNGNPILVGLTDILFLAYQQKMANFSGNLTMVLLQ
jgi:outer membrane protein assembly factor BamB